MWTAYPKKSAVFVDSSRALCRCTLLFCSLFQFPHTGSFTFSMCPGRHALTQEKIGFPFFGGKPNAIIDILASNLPSVCINQLMCRTRVSIKDQNLNFYLETHTTTHQIYFIRLRILPRNWRLQENLFEESEFFSLLQVWYIFKHRIKIDKLNAHIF